MKTIEEVKEHCRFVAEGIVQAVADGEDLGSKFEGCDGVLSNRILIDYPTVQSD